MTQVRGGTLDHVITRTYESISDLCGQKTADRRLFDDESRLLRRQSRMLKRRYRRSGIVLDRLLWIQPARTRRKANRLKENSYWLARISDHSGQPRKLLACLLLHYGLGSSGGRQRGPSGLFVQKIDTIRQSTGGSPPSRDFLRQSKIVLLGSDTDQHPQGAAAGVATVHHCGVQQIPPRRSPSIFPEVCDPLTNSQEARAGC